MYEVHPVALDANVGADQQMIADGIDVAELILLDLQSGASILLSLNKGPYMTITKPFTMEPEGKMARGGIRVKVPSPQAGVVAEFWVVLAEPGAEQGKLNAILL